MSKKPKIHFMSKQDMEKEEATWPAGVEKPADLSQIYYGHIPCESDDAIGVTYLKNKVTCLECLDALEQSGENECLDSRHQQDLKEI